MVYSLTYRRPSKVTSSGESLNGEEKQNSINESVNSGSSCMSNGIPEALSFDRIISNGVCPVSVTIAMLLVHADTRSIFSAPTDTDLFWQPCTTRDFMNYLKYIEYSAENLQFFL